MDKEAQESIIHLGQIKDDITIKTQRYVNRVFDMKEKARHQSAQQSITYEDYQSLL